MELGYVFIWVENVEEALRFYEEAFDLKRRFLVDNGEPGLYAELETGETTFALADHKEARVLFPHRFRENYPARPPGAFQLSFVTPDAEAAYEVASRAGAAETAEPQIQSRGQTIAWVRDPNGVLVSIVSLLLSRER